MDCPTCNGDRGYQSTTALGNRDGWTECDDCDGTGLVPVKDDEPGSDRPDGDGASKSEVLP